MQSGCKSIWFKLKLLWQFSIIFSCIMKMHPACHCFMWTDRWVDWADLTGALQCCGHASHRTRQSTHRRWGISCLWIWVLQTWLILVAVEVLTAVTMKSAVFCDVILYGSIAAWISLWPWEWRQCVLPKCPWTSTWFHFITPRRLHWWYLFV